MSARCAFRVTERSIVECCCPYCPMQVVRQYVHFPAVQYETTTSYMVLHHSYSYAVISFHITKQSFLYAHVRIYCFNYDIGLEKLNHCQVLSTVHGLSSVRVQQGFRRCHRTRLRF